jgi:replication initiator protein
MNDCGDDMFDDLSAGQAGLTPVKHRRLESSIDIYESPAERIVYQHTVLCQTALPYQNPGDHVRRWERQQGVVALEVDAGRARNPHTRRYEDVGLPYGSRPRLILAHLNREALLRGCPRIEVEDSLTAFMRRIQQADPNGREIRRFKDQLSRLAAASVRMAVDLSEDHAFQVDTKIVDVLDLWLVKDERQRVLWPSVVELSPRYFDSLTRHAVPLDERAIGALANSALALDVYSWLAQRLHRVSVARPQRITWVALHEQFGQGYRHIRQFRAALLRVLALVKTQYPAARVEADGGGFELRNSPPPVASRLVPVRELLE